MSGERLDLTLHFRVQLEYTIGALFPVELLDGDTRIVVRLVCTHYDPRTGWATFAATVADAAALRRAMLHDYRFVKPDGEL